MGQSLSTPTPMRATHPNARRSLRSIKTSKLRAFWCMFWCMFVPGFCSGWCIIVQSLPMVYVLQIKEMCGLLRECAEPCNVS